MKYFNHSNIFYFPFIAILCLTVSDNGLVIVAGFADGHCTVWRTDLGSNIRQYCDLVGHDNYIKDILIFYPQILTASGDGTVKKWHLPSKELVQTWRGHDAPVTALGHFGSNVYTASLDHTVILWNYDAGTPIARFVGHAAAIGCLEMVSFGALQFGDLLVTGSADNTVRLWRLDSGEMVQVLGHVVASDPRNPASKFLQPIPDAAHRAPISTLVYARSIQLLFSGSADGTIRGWVPPSWECSLVMDNYCPVTHLRFLDDMLYSGGSNGTVNLWSIEMRTGDGFNRQILPVARILTKFSPIQNGDFLPQESPEFRRPNGFGTNNQSAANAVSSFAKFGRFCTAFFLLLFSFQFEIVFI